jgi:hypothetical protein
MMTVIINQSTAGQSDFFSVYLMAGVSLKEGGRQGND